MVEEYHLNPLKTISPCQQHGCCQMIPTNLGLVNHSFIHRVFIFNLFPHSLLCKIALMLNPCRLIASAIIFITATSSISFKNQNEDEEVWTLERAETVLLRWSVLVYSLVFALWFCLNIWLRRRSAKGSVLRGFSLGATAGSMAGNMWCTRVAAVFAADCASAHVCSAWGHWLPWIVLTGAVFFAVVNVPYMAKGMQKYEALYMVTVFQGSNIVSNSLSALIILQEMDGAPWWKLLGYIGCIVVMIGALWFLVSGKEAVCPSNELDDDLRRVLSMEEGSELEDSESEDEPDLMDFVRAMSLDQFSPLSFSSWSSNAEDSQDGEGSQTGEEEQHEESDNDIAIDWNWGNCSTGRSRGKASPYASIFRSFDMLEIQCKMQTCRALMFYKMTSHWCIY